MTPDTLILNSPRGATFLRDDRDAVCASVEDARRSLHAERSASGGQTSPGLLGNRVMEAAALVTIVSVTGATRTYGCRHPRRVDDGARPRLSESA